MQADIRAILHDIADPTSRSAKLAVLLGMIDHAELTLVETTVNGGSNLRIAGLCMMNIGKIIQAKRDYDAAR